MDNRYVVTMIEATSMLRPGESLTWDLSPRDQLPHWYAVVHNASGAIERSRPLGPRAEIRTKYQLNFL